MKAFRVACALLVFIFLMGPSSLLAQSNDFEADAVGGAYPGIGWTATDLEAVVVDDPFAGGNKVLQVTQHNYNAAPVVQVVLPVGKTLADYTTFSFDAYFASGDVGYKDIVVEAYGAMPSAQFANNAAARLGAYNRAMMGSTAWEHITIDITNTSDLSGTIYLAFGFNGAGTGDVGGAGSTTVWYADNVELSGASSAAGLVSDWGAFYRLGWNTTDVFPGGATMSGDGPPAGNWATLRGAFPEELTATTEQAVVVTGKMTFEGGGPSSWSALRFGMFRHDNPGTLSGVGTDTVRWTGGAEAGAYGYMISSKSGTNDPTSGNGGNGSSWAINGGSWISTFGGGTVAMDPIDQAPRRAVFEAGTYDFAISVMDLGDGTHELRYYIVSEDGVSYWYADRAVDTTQASLSFNGVAFGINNTVDSGITSMTVSDVTVGLGAPIEIPEKPFSSFYVDAWGAIGTRLAGSTWTLKNDSTTLVGDAIMGGTGPVSGWAAIAGGFGETISATTSEALIVRGEFEVVGGELSNWNPLRFGVFDFRDLGVLNDQYTESAQWGYTRYAGTDSATFVASETQAYGYLITNQTGSQTPVSGNGGVGSAFVVNGGSWISTFSGGTVALGSPYDHAPRRAVMPAGEYEFEMSVRPLPDGTTEFRWYIISDDEESYWHAGIHIDTTAQKSNFNAFAFGLQTGGESSVTGLNLYAVEVDRGAPITIPDAPFSSFYVDAWGAIGNRLDQTGWKLVNDENTLVGDALLSGDVTSAQWTAIRGGFGGTVKATTEEALIVRGKLELVGGEVGHWNPLRFGVFDHTDIGQLNYQNTDSARWSYTNYPGTDSATVVRNEAPAYGYLITSQVGSQTPVSGNGGVGSAFAINGGSWISTFSGGTVALGSPYEHAPRRAIMPAGEYEFEMSVRPLADGTTEFRWYIVHEDGESYWHAGVHIDTTAQKTEFNGFAFSYRPEIAGPTSVNLYEVEVDRGAPITIPDAPWTAFYVEDWGFVNGMFGGAEGDSAWTLIPGDLVGDVTITGDAATGPAAVAGSFGSVVTPTDEALVITADITFEGGGFEDPNSFRFGLFNQDLGSRDSTETVGFVWNGAESANGYLFIPGNGTAAPPAWASGEAGTVGGIAGGPWFEPEGAGAFGLKNVVSSGTPTAGTYELQMSVQPRSAGGIEIRVKLTKEDGSYNFESAIVDDSDTPAATSFNSIVFATNNATTTGLVIEALEVDMGEAIMVSNEAGPASDLPRTFALQQNYPNPFNPTTNIKFDLPETANVTLEVYNLLGQRVMTLVDRQMPAGFHQVSFDAQHLASGIYIYRIKAADFVSTKKMMLVK